jgi:hypothetical protein
MAGGFRAALPPATSVAESDSFEDDLLLVLSLPDGRREDRLTRGPQAFDGRTDGGVNDLGIELVVAMADQVGTSGWR